MNKNFTTKKINYIKWLLGRRLFFITCFLFIIPFLALSQSFENSWINYGQDYYKIKVWRDGIYRINAKSFKDAGIDISNWDTSKIQIFYKGVEQYIYVYDWDHNGHIDNDYNDFIEFYGQRNDGTFDTQMYADPAWQPNSRFSLITDTSVYFITMGTVAGKRLTLQGSDTSTAYNSYSPSNYFIKESYTEKTSTYNAGGPAYPNEDIDYVSAEGWCSGAFTDGSADIEILPTPNVYVGPNVDVNITMAGANNDQHQIQIQGPGLNYTDSLFYGFQVRRYYRSISSALFTSSSTFNFTAVPIAGNNVNRLTFVNLSVKYPHTMDMEGQAAFKMFVPDTAYQGKTRFDFTNFTGTAPIIYDIAGHKRIILSQSGTTFHALVDSGGSSNLKYCYLAGSAQILVHDTSFHISRINYVNLSVISRFHDFSSLAIDSAYFIITHSSFLSTINYPVTGYRDYRNSTTNNKVLVVDVDELYDQFAFGQKNHPMGIKEFARFTLNGPNWMAKHPPQAMFLVGKSIGMGGPGGNQDMVNSPRFNRSLWAQILVTTYGYYPSDMLLTSGINGSGYAPAIPIGRLSAKNTTDVDNYLDKVKQYEDLQAGPPQEWMKEVLHFGGGALASEQTLFKGYLNNLKTIIEDQSYGGHVTSYFKSSTDPIAINQSDSLKVKINNGVSAMTFFGHAAGSSFDISTDVPQNYGNTGKYPIIMASSCFAGNFHSDPAAGLSNSEQFVLEPQKAAIAFLASVGLGFSDFLYNYDTILYNNLSFNFYGQSIGKIIQQTVKRVQATPADPGLLKEVCNEMSLQGDPALKFNSWGKADLAAYDKNIFFTPAIVNSQSDTFSLHFVTRNIAKAVPDTFDVVIDRTFPDGTDSIYKIPRSRCYYADTLTLTMKAGGLNGAGVNKFSVKVDLDTNRIPEIDDLGNNQANASLFIYSSDITPVYPAKYAIYPYSTVTLKASTVNPLGPQRSYKFEIDTAYFNDNPITHSGLYRFSSPSVSASGGVVSWSPANYPLIPNTVYYWRVYDDTTVVNKNESSFIYIPNKTGWSQAHFFQFNHDGYQNVSRDSANRKYTFVPNIAALKVIDYKDVVPDANARTTGYTLNNEVGEYGGNCNGIGASFVVAVIDSLTLQPWNDCNVHHGQYDYYDCNTNAYTCRQRPENYFLYPYSFPVDSFVAMHNWIKSIPNGYYLLFYSWSTFPYSTSPAKPTLDSMFNELHIREWTNNQQDNASFIFFIQKGDSLSKVTKNGLPSDTLIQLNATMQNVWYRGNMTSEVIGPAAKWTNLHWEQHTLEANTKDSINLMITGLDSATNKWDTLNGGVVLSPPAYDLTLSTIDAKVYPYLRLISYQQDLPLRTPPQLDKWQIYYNEAPECALNANRHYTFYKNPLDEGDTLRMSIAIDNIGNVAMDSLPVSFYMYDKNRNRQNLKTYKLDSLRVGQTLNANLEIDTTFGYYGPNSIWVEANPFGSKHLLEQYHFNNLAEVKFNINRDVVNPILDVVFDGVHILDGDIVSGRPHIVIGLHDENKFLALNDTSKFHVYIKSPSQQTKQQLDFSNSWYSSNLRFTPAVLPKNSCKIEFDPVFAQDGIYTLEVEATDRSDNESGKYNYRITFEVINKSTITQVLNYPNPFTTSTRFVFVLTGNEVPDEMRIRIMTVSGKVVREIMRSELGNVHIGRNITDYAWDGTDQYGDRLANGVYLYKVDTQFKNGQEIDHRDSEADKYFKKNWGKMFLMR